MFLDALRWNMLNVIRVELFFNCYRIYNIFISSSLQSPRGQYAVASLLITIFAHLTVQFEFVWLLTIYSVYLAVGLSTWIHRRVYFYHRRLDSTGVNQTIVSFDSAKQSAAISNANYHNNGNASSVGSSATLKADKHKDKDNNGIGSSGGSSSGGGTETNSLQRQRTLAYREFQSILNVPRYTHKEFALSLAHLSNASKLLADKETFDEMHFQLLATRRDVINIILRSLLLMAATLLAYFR